tara:strand:- start:1592 stop:2020 length:429 start_codon:yes stop_codon:yes gene_type:complete
MVKKKTNKKTNKNSLLYYINTLNNSKFFAGMVMIMLNIGSKYITIKLSKTQEAYLRNSIGHQILVFAICWMGTRDIITSLILTTVFIVLTQHLFHEESSFCILPKNWTKLENALDLDGDGKVSDDEVTEAIKILQKAKDKKK